MTNKHTTALLCMRSHIISQKDELNCRYEVSLE